MFGFIGTTAMEAQARVEKTEGSAPLTQDEIEELNTMEKEWATDIDKAVSYMRKKDASGAGIYIKKANRTIARMKELLLAKGYILDSVDRMVAMDRLTEAYGNMARIAGYVSDARSLVANAGSIQKIFSDTREKLLQAYVRFYEVPPLQKLCKQFVEVLDEFEREMNKALSKR